MEKALCQNSGSLLKDARSIIEQARQEAYRSVNIAMIQRNWLLGKRISEEILLGENRAEYGGEVIKRLSKELTSYYGKGFTKNSLYRFVQFYKIFPTVLGKSELLTWSHYIWLLSVNDTAAREWYAHEAFVETWSVRTLQRNIASQYYYRLLQSQNKSAVENEMRNITAPMQNDKTDMYVRMYDELKRTEGDNPTFGLILCSETSADMARYSILKENKQLFQAKYLTYLPTEEELRQEIERQKEIFLEQQRGKDIKLEGK